MSNESNASFLNAKLRLTSIEICRERVNQVRRNLHESRQLKSVCGLKINLGNYGQLGEKIKPLFDGVLDVRTVNPLLIEGTQTQKSQSWFYEEVCQSISSTTSSYEQSSVKMGG